MKRITLPLADIASVTNVCFDDATINQKIISKTGDVFIGKFGNIKDGKYTFEQDEECIAYQKHIKVIFN